MIVVIIVIIVVAVLIYEAKSNSVRVNEWPKPINAPAKELLKELKDLIKTCSDKEVKKYLRETILESVKSEMSFESWLHDMKNANIEFDFQDEVVQAIYELYGQSVTIDFMGVTYKTIKDEKHAEKMKSEFEAKKAQGPLSAQGKMKKNSFKNS